MTTPLRAFLMLRSATGEWTVSVFRDLDDILRAWEARQNPDETSGVVHVGFERPPASAFDELASNYVGQVLLTASARYAIQGGFQASNTPVGSVEGLPIFQATRGWGYVAKDAAPPFVMDTPQHPFSDWIEDFAAAKPDLSAALRSAGIFNDDTYLLGEGALPNDLRRSLGIFRSRQMTAEHAGDPCFIAKFAPPWLLDRKIETLGPSVRLSNALINLNVETVGDLRRFSTAELLRVPNLGRTSIKDLVDCLERGLKTGPTSEEASMAAAAEVTLLEGIRRSLVLCDPKSADIIRRRMGLDCPPETLQQIGESHGVTRERIRQLEAKTVRKLVKEEVWDDLLTRKLAHLLSEREFPLPLLGVEAADPWFTGVSEFPEAMDYLLKNMSEGGAAIVDVDGVAYFGFLDQLRWESSIREASRLLESGVGKGWSETYCRLLVGGLLPERSKEFQPLLWDLVSKRCHFVEQGEDQVLTSYGRGTDHVVEAVLQASDRPLHFTEIAELATARAKRPIELTRAHNSAQSVGFLVGRGTYGAMKHLPLSASELDALSDQAVEIVNSGRPERQWHVTEILAALMDQGAAQPGLVGKYVLDIALQRSGDLARLGRMVWTQRTDADSDAARIDIRQAVIAILQQADRPLRSAEIRQRLIALRGLGQHFQMWAVDPIIRMGPALWGINDRDIVLKRDQQPAAIEEAVAMLYRQQRGVHISEYWQSGVTWVPGLPAEVVFCLATSDPRLKVNSGQYLYLTEWGDARREALPDALAAIMGRSSAPQKLDDLWTEVQARIGRPCPRQVVSSCLQAIEATFVDGVGWSLAPARDHEPEGVSLEA